jgi:nitrogen fixation NifU-like protein|tara:strand:- start:101 stop:496 length:396 start_codon:yes stop_codon:yes gene_type:complete
MNLNIIKIASNTENHKIIKNHTHFSKNKNPICGDEMSISLVVKDNKLIDFGYQCKSCIYCQASVSLLSRNVIKLTLDEVSNLLKESEIFFKKNNTISDKWKIFKDIIDKENISRKECLLLPFKTLSKALEL